jgi:cytosine/adenosine deaminase-related metal-dependent hydrolase
MPDDLRVYQARYVFSGQGEPIAQGLIAVRGERIDYVGPPDGRAVDVAFPTSTITPGFVNAHTHFELGGLVGKLDPPESFAGWLRRVVAFRRSQSQEQLQSAVADGIRRSLEAGVTLVGDIATAGQSWSLLADSPLAALVFYELIGMQAARAGRAVDAARDWLAQVKRSARCRPGFSPHAPYTVRPTLVEQIGTTAAQHDLPVAVHWAESKEELEFLGGGGGPLRDFLCEMGAWDETADASGLLSLGTLRAALAGARTLLIHANYVHAAQLAEVARGSRWSVVFCPRTHAYFGHRDHPFGQLLEAGMNVCVGTDSLASNPDLSVLEELRFLYRRGAMRDGAALLHMGTAAGARALGFEDHAGSLAPGKWADLAVVALPARDEPDPYRLLFDSEAPVESTLCRGRFVYQHDGSPPPR